MEKRISEFALLIPLFVLGMSNHDTSLPPQPPDYTSYRTRDFVPCNPNARFCGLPYELTNCTRGDHRARDDKSGKWHRVCLVSDLDRPTVRLPYLWGTERSLVLTTYYLITGAPYEPIAIHWQSRLRMKSNLKLPQGSVWHPHRKADRFLIIGAGRDRNITFIVEREGSRAFPLVTKYVQNRECGMWEQTGRWVFMPAHGHGTEAC